MYVRAYDFKGHSVHLKMSIEEYLDNFDSVTTSIWTACGSGKGNPKTN